MKLGVMVEGQEGLTWERWRQLMACVEELGFESLWRSDHFLSIVNAQRQSLDTWPSLTLAAAATTRLRFGPLVCPMTFRHPALLAHTAAAVDELSGGRLILGLGAGWNELEHRALGLLFPPLKERMDRLEEGLQVIRVVLGDAPGPFVGRYYQLEGLPPRPQAGQRRRLPVLIGTTGMRRMLRIVARYADEWDVPGIITSAAYRARSQRLTAYCRAIGRDPQEIRRCVSTAFLIGRDDAEFGRRLEAMQQLLPHIAGLNPSAAVETLTKEEWLIGTPAQIVASLRALAAEGVERVMLQHNDQSDFEALELIAREVMPAVATWAPRGSRP